MKLGKRIAALFLVFAMVFALAPPLSAFAETAETVPETSVPIETSTEASTDPTEGTAEATEETAAQATTSPTEETEATEVPEETTEATEGTEATEVPEETTEATEETEETPLLGAAAANEETTVLDDFLAIAAAQVGVTADEDGITIYDTWWDDTDMSGDWTAKFVSYCLYEAGIEIIPYESDWGMLYTILSASNSTSQTYIYLDITYTPVVGDIVIWDTDGDGTADHGGIITAIDANGYTIIEGTANNMVEAVAYTDSTGIMGVIPVSEICGLSSISVDATFTLVHNIGSITTKSNSALNLRAGGADKVITSTGENGKSVSQNISYLDWHAIGSNPEDIVYCICPELEYGTGSGFDSVTGVTIGTKPDNSWYASQGYTWGNPQDYGLQVWDSFTENQQYAIMLVLYYGCPNSLWDSTAGTSTTGTYATTNGVAHNPNIAYRAATQAIIREIIGGWRNTTGTYAIKSAYANIYLDAYAGKCTNSSGTIDYFEYAYTYIESMLAKHNSIPSFASTSASSAPAYEVTGTTLNLSDTNGVANLFTYSSGGGMTFAASGANTVVGTKTGTLSDATITATRSVYSPYDSSVEIVFARANSSFQSLIRISSSTTTTKSAYFSVKSSAVPFTLQKSSASTSAVGASISGNSNYSLAGAKYGVYVNGTLMETLTTDSSGKATSSLTYAVGTTITIKETTAPTGYSLDSTTYTFTIQSSGNTFSVSDTPITKQFTLQKTIAGGTTVQNEISGNGMYSLAGAKYEVYANGQYSETLTTDSSGKATSTKYYTLGTKITVKETVAPTGYKLDNTEYTFTIVNGTNTFSVSDEPVFDPPFAITKVDASTTTAQGNSSFSGAVFKFEYFANDSWSGTATRTWYFKTNANGVAYYDSSYLASGYTSDALYVDANGKVGIPLGTVKITEVVNSLGYTVLPDSLYCSVVEDSQTSSGAKYVWTSASLQYVYDMEVGSYSKYGIYEPANTNTYGSLTIQKADEVLGTTLPSNISFEGCEFAVYNMSTNSVKIGNFDVAAYGEICYTFRVDSSGTYSTDKIFPIGTYKVVETKGNEYYEVNSTWSYEFTVTGATTAAATSFSATCTNTAIPGEISILKTDTSTNALSGAKFLLEWSQDGTTWTAVTSTQGLGYCSSTGLTDGTLTTGTDGKITFTGLHPGLQYRLTEVEAPNGYSLLTDTAWQGLLTDWDDYTVSLRVVNSEVYILPAAGSSGLWLYPFIGTASMLAIALYLATRKKRTVK